jgi:hypothetical protein
VEASADGLGALTAVGPVDAWSASAVSVTFFVDVAPPVDICRVPVKASVDDTGPVRGRVLDDVTRAESSVFPVSMAGAAAAGFPDAVTDAESLSGGLLADVEAMVALAGTAAIPHGGRPKTGAIKLYTYCKGARTKIPKKIAPTRIVGAITLSYNQVQSKGAVVASAGAALVTC